jgi:hypothetical protein
MHKTYKVVGAKKLTCDPQPYLKSIPNKKRIPRLYTMARAMDTLRKKINLKLPPPHDKVIFHDVFEDFVLTDSYEEFVKRIFTAKKGIDPKKYDKQTKKIYNDFLPFRKGRYLLHEENYKTKVCKFKITTSMNYDPKQVTESFRNKAGLGKMDIAFDIYTTIIMDCSCSGKGKNAVKSASMEFSGKAYNRNGLQSGTNYFFDTPSPYSDINKKPEFFLRLRNVQCCPAKTPKAEDGSFMDPDENEDIAFPNQFIEVGAGLSTAKDEETELCASVGFMHNLLPGEENALFVGGRASVHNASFSGPDFSQTFINVGPAVEYQTFIGNTATKWFNGLNGAFVFGSQDSSGSKTDISGIKIGLYTGVEVPLGNQFALGVMATLLEYNNQTFKTDDSEFKSNSTGINLNKGSVGLSLRIDLDSNN